VKPRIFIGSSANSRAIAEAIHAQLEQSAECTVWTEGAFDLSVSTMTGLLKNLRDSDFGIFVFTPDDVTTVKGELLKVARDNVVYEAGLFSGHLCPERCFIAVPRIAAVHIPTDLLGMTLGYYDDGRTDGNNEAAVAPFCLKVRQQIKQNGLFKGYSSEELRELVVRFECCQSWIIDESKRVETKKRISAQIDQFCNVYQLNKHRLLQQNRTGYYLALLAAIRFRPESSDWELILKIDGKQLPPGFVYFKLIESIETLKTNRCVEAAQLKRLQEWLNALPDGRKHISSRIDSLI
jgi:hypothetical protein